MFGLFRSLFVGMIQGLTEFLPVSSSGHLVLLLNLTEWNREKILSLIIFLHIATTLAVLVYFRREIKEIIRGYTGNPGDKPAEGRRLLLFIVMGTIPTVIIALSMKDFFENLFSSPRSVAVGLAITGLALFISERMSSRSSRTAPLSSFKAFIIGMAQGIAIAPGVSRSGATISAGLFTGIDRNEAFTFSFLLSVPANVGALLLEVKHLGLFSFGDILLTAAGMAAAFISGYAALALLSRWVREGKLFVFSVYCWALAAVTVFVIL